jgi:glutathione synthase/RimK-type ligase-like ATP-grasp enzyme
MIKSILLLTDYKGFFGSKQKTKIYRAGMDVPKLIDLFKEKGYHAEAIRIADLDMKDVIINNPIIIYTSSEDKNGFYKSFIEDVIYNLEENEIVVMPRFSCLKSHNNKVAMELLRERSGYKPIQTIKSKIFGTIEELKKNADSFIFPVVIKTASGAMSKGVARADNPEELIRKAKIISKSKDFWHNTKELLRLLKYRNKYIRESFHRNKFIVQNLIPNLNNDWKVLVYGSRCYALYRGNRDNDFRASGSGKFEFRKNIPEGMLDFAMQVKNHFNVPHISLDIGFDGNIFHLIEFQFINFGTTTIEKSPFYFELIDNIWEIKETKSDLEEVYVNSVTDFLINAN